MSEHYGEVNKMIDNLQRAITYIESELHNHLLAEKADGSDGYYVGNANREAAFCLHISLNALREKQERERERQISEAWKFGF